MTSNLFFYLLFLLPFALSYADCISHNTLIKSELAELGFEEKKVAPTDLKINTYIDINLKNIFACKNAITIANLAKKKYQIAMNQSNSSTQPKDIISQLTKKYLAAKSQINSLCDYSKSYTQTTNFNHPYEFIQFQSHISNDNIDSIINKPKFENIIDTVKTYERPSQKIYLYYHGLTPVAYSVQDNKNKKIYFVNLELCPAISIVDFTLNTKLQKPIDCTISNNQTNHVCKKIIAIQKIQNESRSLNDSLSQEKSDTLIKKVNYK